MRVMVYDDTQRKLWSQKGLSHFWRLGSFLGRFDVVIPASSWDHAYDELAKARTRGPISQLQVWGHGQAGTPLLDDEPVGLYSLSMSLNPSPETVIWWRSCDVAKGERGQRFMRETSRLLGCSVVGHCAVISSPNPLWQREICGLRPDEEAWWPLDGAGLGGCGTLTMRVPAHAWRGGARG